MHTDTEAKTLLLTFCLSVKMSLERQFETSSMCYSVTLSPGGGEQRTDEVLDRDQVSPDKWITLFWTSVGTEHGLLAGTTIAHGLREEGKGDFYY